jgi:hypothetical protein
VRKRGSADGLMGCDSVADLDLKLPNENLVGFAPQTDFFDWVLFLAGKLDCNQIITGYPNRA